MVGRAWPKREKEIEDGGSGLGLMNSAGRRKMKRERREEKEKKKEEGKRGRRRKRRGEK